MARHVEPEVVSVETRELSDWGEYERLVRLETRDDVLLGSVDAVKIDPRTGNLLVGDFRSSKRAYLFDRNGRYLASYGDPASEKSPYFYLSDIALLASGQVFLAAGNRGLIFSPQGQLMDNIFFDYAPDEVLTLGERVYIRGHSAGRKILQRSVFVYDSSWKKRGSFHPYDERRDRFAYLPIRSLGTANGLIYVSDIYDYRITAYDPEGDEVATYSFANFNQDIAPLWQLERSELTKEDRLTLINGVHRVQSLRGFDDGLYLYESNLKRNILRYTMLSLGREVLYRYPNLELVFTGDGNGDYFSVDRIVGSYGGGLLGICDDPERIERYRERYSILEGVEYQVTENPVVLFFKLKFPSGEQT